MRYVILIIFLIALSACTFQVQVVTPESPTAIVASELQSATPSLSEISTSTPSPLPTNTSILPAFTPTPLSRNENTTPIQFGENGTYVDVVDSIPAGTSKTYSIHAFAGQVMSISILQSLEGDWSSVPMKIVGADGGPLCPSDLKVCYFWRGVLPTSQNYFVTLTPATSASDFTMRVAINPPGVATQSFPYLSKNQKVSFSYSDEFAPVRFPGPQVYKIASEFALQLIDTKFHTGTNLNEAYFLFGSTNDSSLVANCTQPTSAGGPEYNVGEANINGIDFVRSERTGVGLGNAYQQIFYRTTHNGVCYEIIFHMHSSSVGAMPAEWGIKEFDRPALLQKFEAVLSTLNIRE